MCKEKFLIQLHFTEKKKRQQLDNFVRLIMTAAGTISTKVPPLFGKLKQFQCHAACARYKPTFIWCSIVFFCFCLKTESACFAIGQNN